MYEKELKKAMEAYGNMIAESSQKHISPRKKRENAAKGQYALSIFGNRYLKYDNSSIQFVENIEDANKFKNVEEAEGFANGLSKLMSTLMAKKIV